jgi:hypothetical protein
MSRVQTDLIIVNDSVYRLFTHPLGQYWELNDNKPSLFSTRSGNTRGYTAKWLILNDKLYLTEFWGETIYPKYKEYNLQDLFPNQEMVFADWFTGTITIGIGHQSVDYNIERYQVKIEIIRGLVSEISFLDFD